MVATNDVCDCPWCVICCRADSGKKTLWCHLRWWRFSFSAGRKKRGVIISFTECTTSIPRPCKLVLQFFLPRARWPEELQGTHPEHKNKPEIVQTQPWRYKTIVQ